jgi:hypothetical protein
MMHVFRLSMVVIVCLFLAGCNGVPLTTIWKMRKLDPLTADPAQVRIALRGPEWMAPMFDDMKILIRSNVWHHDPLSYAFQLKKIDAAREGAELRSAGLAPEGLTILQVNPVENASMREALESILAYKKAGYQGATSVALWNRDLSGCTGFLPPEGPIIMDVYVHLDDSSGWMPLFENRDFSDEIGKIDQTSANCEIDTKMNAAKTGAVSSSATAKSRTKDLRGGVSFQFKK